MTNYLDTSRLCPLCNEDIKGKDAHLCMNTHHPEVEKISRIILNRLADCAAHLASPVDSHTEIMERLTSLISRIEEGERGKYNALVLPKVQKFIDKVESGRARSKETYADMLEIRSALSNPLHMSNTTGDNKKTLLTHQNTALWEAIEGIKRSLALEYIEGECVECGGTGEGSDNPCSDNGETYPCYLCKGVGRFEGYRKKTVDTALSAVQALIPNGKDV